MPEETARIPFSQHIFLLPFTYEAPPGPAPAPPPWTRVSNHLASSACPLWCESWFAPHEGGLAYNEYQYFHPHVREQYFSMRDSKAALRFFKLRLGQAGQATFRLHWSGAKEPFALEIKGISLRICQTGIGLLSIELHNHQHPSLDDVLRINDLGRRAFPAFMDAQTPDAAIAANAAPMRVEIEVKGFQAVGEFHDQHFMRPGLAMAGHLVQIMASAGFSLEGADNPARLPFSFRPTADDRMFVVCWYGSDELSAHLSKKHEDGSYLYEKDPDWYRFTFLDGGELLCQHEGMRRELIAQTTYKRWADWGTIYGLTRYSLVCLTDRRWFGPNVIRHHMRGIYAQMAAMLLIQRASLLRFSQQVGVSSLALAEGQGLAASPEKVGAQAQRLQADFLSFFNRLWSREVSPQEQGLEMYNLAYELVGLGKAMEELRAEIHDLYDYLRLDQERDENRGVQGLTKLGALFLPMSVLAALFSMNLEVFEQLLHKESWLSLSFKGLVFVGLAGFVYYGVRLWLQGHGPEMSFAAKELRLGMLLQRLKDGRARK